jgi:hypothetical protein
MKTLTKKPLNNLNNFMSDEISHNEERPEELDAMVAAPPYT